MSKRPTEIEQEAAGVNPDTGRISISPKPSAELEARDFAAPKHLRERAEVEGIREGNKNQRANRRLRWKYARWVFCYLVCYSIFTSVLLVLSGFKIGGFSLPPDVLNFLVGSTAAAAIGLVAAVVNGLFRSN